MPFPNYTEAECVAEIQRIDAAISELVELSTKFTLERKSFDYSGKLAELQALRGLWVERHAEATGAAGTAPRSMRATLVSGRPRQELLDMGAALRPSPWRR